jgi:hypothetical protein
MLAKTGQVARIDAFPGPTSRHDLPYHLGCLAVGLFLGAGLGGAVAPGLVRAENGGIYDFIRANADYMRGKAAPDRPQASQPAAAHRDQFVVRLRRPPHRIAARLSPAHRQADTIVGTGARPACATCSETPAKTVLEQILNDVTLRAGDTVILKGLALVFRGGLRPPYDLADFTDFRRSSMLTRSERRQLDDELGLTRNAEALHAFNLKGGTIDASLDIAKTPTPRKRTHASAGIHRTVRSLVARPQTGM